LPPEVFGPSYQPPRTDTGPNALRENLKKARALLEEAGWKVAADGVLRNAKGEPIEFEYLEPESSNQFCTVIWQRNLAKLGINLKSRIVDFALYRKRLETFDFDTITIRTPDFALPSALDYRVTGFQGGGRAGLQATSGLESTAVDAMRRR
jgi:ABC-type oligopeptide transport system substrate-binding subunit